MANRFYSLLSILPLALLATVTWRLIDSEPVSAATESSKPEGQAADLKADLSFLARYTPLDQDAIFVSPAGPKGLDYSPRAASLKSHKVRLRGWMVKHLHSDPRVFLLNSRPMVLNMSEYGLADDLPPSAVHVILPLRRGFAPSWTPRELEVCGVLELGPRQEADGRISHVRLVADHVIDIGAGTLPELCIPIGLQPGRVAAAAVERSIPAVPLPPPVTSPQKSSPQPQ